MANLPLSFGKTNTILHKKLCEEDKQQNKENVWKLKTSLPPNTAAAFEITGQFSKHNPMFKTQGQTTEQRTIQKNKKIFKN